MLDGRGEEFVHPVEKRLFEGHSPFLGVPQLGCQLPELCSQPGASRTGVSWQAPPIQPPKPTPAHPPAKDTSGTPQALRIPNQETLCVTRSAGSPAWPTARLPPEALGFSVHPAGQTDLKPNQSHYLPSLGTLNK